MAEVDDRGEFVLRSPLPQIVPPMVHVDLVDCKHHVRACFCNPADLRKDHPNA